MYQTNSTPVTATTLHKTENGSHHDIIVDNNAAVVSLVAADMTEVVVPTPFSTADYVRISFGCAFIKITGATGGQVISWGE